MLLSASVLPFVYQQRQGVVLQEDSFLVLGLLFDSVNSSYLKVMVMHVRVFTKIACCVAEVCGMIVLTTKQCSTTFLLKVHGANVATIIPPRYLQTSPPFYFGFTLEEVAGHNVSASCGHVCSSLDVCR